MMFIESVLYFFYENYIASHLEVCGVSIRRRKFLRLQAKRAARHCPHNYCNNREIKSAFFHVLILPVNKLT